MGRGTPEAPGTTRGTPRYPADQDGVTGGLRWAEQEEARKREAGKTEELRRGDKGHSGFRENAVRVRRSAEGPWLAGQCLPSRVGPGRRARRARPGSGPGIPELAGSPALFPGTRAQSPPQSPRGSASGRDGDGLRPFPEGEGGREQGREARQSLGLPSCILRGCGQRRRRGLERAPGPNENRAAAGSFHLERETRRPGCAPAQTECPSPLPGVDKG